MTQEELDNLFSRGKLEALRRGHVLGPSIKMMDSYGRACAQCHRAVFIMKRDGHYRLAGTAHTHGCRSKIG